MSNDDDSTSITVSPFSGVMTSGPVGDVSVSNSNELQDSIEKQLKSEIAGLDGLSDMTSMADKKKIQQDLVIWFLKAKKGVGGGVSSREIIKWVEQFSFYSYLEKYWNSNLSQIARGNDGIRRIPGKYNYFYDEPRVVDDVPVVVVSDSRILDDSSSLIVSGGSSVSAKKLQEKHLYVCLTDWLVSKEYQAKDTSNLKTGGKWGNPDVTGIKIHANITEQKSVEICTVEAKINHDNWRTLIFEAISHKRFSNRVYFIFAIISNEVSEELIPDFEDFRLYGEKYGIGIAAMFIPEDVNSDPKDLDLGDVEIREIWPAIYQYTLPGQSEIFLRDQLRIPDLKALYNFGRGGDN